MSEAKWTVGQEVGTGVRGAGYSARAPFKGKVVRITAHRVYARLTKADGHEVERTFTEGGRAYPWYSGTSTYLKPWDAELEDLWQAAKAEHAKRQRRDADARRKEAERIEKHRAVIDLLQRALDKYALAETETVRDARAFLEQMKPGAES